ncbi:chemotaxis response regulator protein-glutamate methylesterase [Bacillus pumilus]|uniref:protein-glutamate methylesterase/protein-glutamine glutaminase n=1 Tax=Bacillus TaxID=1386 RepID=UPI000D02BE20|nr:MULTISPECIES: chemotaxis response regulator protein-glutamate methylesterase [Bacillus]MDF2001785.1 chemotaxis response regulator protein-glutamate methylesterase [Bacillus pumilus]MDF2023040.1 chemotaxis response regulator protein-glutamate methylesterase [Bacillus pumilus]MDF2026667.1 chemotaxis response regulator protein-glutamate methylesterase [Bacillus pumilus]MDF2087850.1 chemotaxis response regulator protein-glutamate methylesterase [Bacillus pumilus]PRS40949.1 chemotaxis response r
MIRVLVVDDSAFMRKLISDFLSAEQEIEVVGTARNGEDALKRIKELNPDVVTLDVEMPVLNGTEALKQILAEHDLAVIMVSSQTKQGKDLTIHCLELGAFDFVTKPSGSISLDLHKVRGQIVERVLAAGMSRKRTEVQISPKPVMKTPSPVAFPRPQAVKSSSLRKIISIGTSTGGPRALQRVVTKLPKDIEAPILIVQHMPAGFTASLATRLDHLSQISIKEAQDGDIAKNGVAYIAPGGMNMSLHEQGASLVIRLSPEDTESRHKPSVNYLFESISNIKGYEKIAVIMTGMGSDGTEGVKKMVASGPTKVIAEKEESCVVFGMPKSVIKAGLAHETRHVDDIAHAIISSMKKERA